MSTLHTTLIACVLCPEAETLEVAHNGELISVMFL